MKKPKWKIIVTALFFITLTSQCHKQDPSFLQQTQEPTLNDFP